MENVIVFRFMFKNIFFKCFGRKRVFEYAGLYDYKKYAEGLNNCYEKYNCFMCMCVAINLNIIVLSNIIVLCICIV